MKRFLTPNELFILDRSRFAAQMIADFISEFGESGARNLIAESLARDAYSPLTASILKTAWGGGREWPNVGG